MISNIIPFVVNSSEMSSKHGSFCFSTKYINYCDSVVRVVQV